MRGVRLIWFHHIKSLEKRKDIISMARRSGLRGLCKPGFPGVVAIEGADDECNAFVDALRDFELSISALTARHV